MSRLAGSFASAAADDRAAFIAFIEAGDPDLETTAELLSAFGRIGVDVVEVGVPFSDPIADGPTIQRAVERSLASGTTMMAVLDMIDRARQEPDCPAIVLFSYLNPIHALGYERFAREASSAGVDGLLLTDLPIDEDEAIHSAVAEAGIDMIPLLSPTSDDARLQVSLEKGSGFVYYISRTGVTGARVGLARGLARQVRAVRKKVDMPVAVGFGISTPEQVATVAQFADGVVVGSKIVAEIEAAPTSRIEGRVVRLVRPLVAACRRRR